MDGVVGMTWWQVVLVGLALWVVGGSIVVYLWLRRGARKMDERAAVGCIGGRGCQGDRHGWEDRKSVV